MSVCVCECLYVCVCVRVTTKQMVNILGFVGNKIFVITTVMCCLMIGYILRNTLLCIFVIECHKRELHKPGW